LGALRPRNAWKKKAGHEVKFHLGGRGAAESKAPTTGKKAGKRTGPRQTVANLMQKGRDGGEKRAASAKTEAL